MKENKAAKNAAISVLNQSDTYSLMLFALYKLKDTPEYSCISELAYVLDKSNLFKLCEFFGGLTIKIPTKEELSDITKALYLYQRIDVENADVRDALHEIDMSIGSYKGSSLMKCYNSVKDTMAQYSFGKTYD